MYFIVFNMYYVSHILFYLFLFKTEWPVFQCDFSIFTTIMPDLLLHFTLFTNFIQFLQSFLL